MNEGGTTVLCGGIYALCEILQNIGSILLFYKSFFLIFNRVSVLFIRFAMYLSRGIRGSNRGVRIQVFISCYQFLFRVICERPFLFYLLFEEILTHRVIVWDILLIKHVFSILIGKTVIH